MPSYAIGLLIGLMWVRANIAVENLKSPKPEEYLLGWLHMGAIIAASLIAFFAFVPEGYKYDLTDRMNQPDKPAVSQQSK